MIRPTMVVSLTVVSAEPEHVTRVVNRPPWTVDAGWCGGR
jgi:hypothetical protein